MRSASGRSDDIEFLFSDNLPTLRGTGERELFNFLPGECLPIDLCGLPSLLKRSRSPAVSDPATLHHSSHRVLSLAYSSPVRLRNTPHLPVSITWSSACRLSRFDNPPPRCTIHLVRCGELENSGAADFSRKCREKKSMISSNPCTIEGVPLA